MTPEAQSRKEKVDQLDLTQIKNFWFSKDTVRKMKRQTTDWEKMFAKSVSDRKDLYLVYIKKIPQTQ